MSSKKRLACVRARRRTSIRWPYECTVQAGGIKRTSELATDIGRPGELALTMCE